LKLQIEADLRIRKRRRLTTDENAFEDVEKESDQKRSRSANTDVQNAQEQMRKLSQYFKEVDEEPIEEVVVEASPDEIANDAANVALQVGRLPSPEMSHRDESDNE
jgi:hypothetical protein